MQTCIDMTLPTKLSLHNPSKHRHTFSFLSIVVIMLLSSSLLPHISAFSFGKSIPRALSTCLSHPLPCSTQPTYVYTQSRLFLYSAVGSGKSSKYNRDGSKMGGRSSRHKSPIKPRVEDTKRFPTDTTATSTQGPKKGGNNYYTVTESSPVTSTPERVAVSLNSKAANSKAASTSSLKSTQVTTPKLYTNKYLPKARKSSSKEGGYRDKDGEGTRINKCLPSLSRRSADEAVAAGRVTVNDQIITSAGHKVHWNDIVKLDGKKQTWQPNIRAKFATPAAEFDEQDFMYLKYWKPVGVTCTSDAKDPNNIISKGKFTMLPQRVFTVGRLDRDSTGLILLTSDGRVNTALLHRSQVKEKVYEVTTDRTISDSQLQQLRQGIMITTPVQRASSSSSSKMVTAKTLPCQVQRLSANQVSMTLIEGRNRQIRRMMDALSLRVVDLHRVSFAGITLSGLAQPGTWKELSAKEMKVIQQALKVNDDTTTSKSTKIKKDIATSDYSESDTNSMFGMKKRVNVAGDIVYSIANINQNSEGAVVDDGDLQDFGGYVEEEDEQ